MGMGQGVRTGLGHGGITCVLQTQFSSYIINLESSTAFCQSGARKLDQGLTLGTASGSRGCIG